MSWKARIGAFLLLATSALSAGGADAHAPVFSSDVRMVRLNVIVQDAQGRMVTNLQASDFTVSDDGQPQRLELFGRAYEPGQDDLMTLDLGMLFDTSESMLGELRLSQEAAARFLESIPRARDLMTIFFDQDIRISRYDSENQQGLSERIWSAKGGGNTALYDSIAVYLARVGDGPGRKVLVLFTDGEDSTSALSLSEMLQLLKASSVTVYAIGFSGGFARGSQRAFVSTSVLRSVTSLTGGTVFTPRTSKDLPEIYASILKELESQYVLGYPMPDGRADGRFHKLKVTLKDRNLKVRSREGYTTPAAQRAER